jgi:hypothetical protein
VIVAADDDVERRGALVHPLRTYLASWAAHGLDEDDLREIHSALGRTSAQVSAAAGSVVYLRSSYVPDLDRWVAVFVADEPDLVLRVTTIAQLPSVEVHRAVELVVSGGIPPVTHDAPPPDERNPA